MKTKNADAWQFRRDLIKDASIAPLEVGKPYQWRRYDEGGAWTREVSTATAEDIRIVAAAIAAGRIDEFSQAQPR